MKATIADLSRRYPLPSNTSPEQHRDRLELLIEDCMDMDPRLLRAACQRAARECRFLPSAAELHGFAKDAASAPVDEDWGQQRARQFNLDNIAGGSPVRAVVREGNWELFRPGSPGEKRRCDGQGGIVVPWYSKGKQAWIYPDGSEA